jgi:hypothetical protein
LNILLTLRSDQCLSSGERASLYQPPIYLEYSETSRHPASISILLQKGKQENILVKDFKPARNSLADRWHSSFHPSGILCLRD